MTLKGLPRLLHLFFVPLPVLPLPLTYHRSFSLILSFSRFFEMRRASSGFSISSWLPRVNPAKRRFNWIDTSATAKTGKQVISIYEFLTGDNKFGTIAVCIIARDVLRPFLFFYGATFLGREPRAYRRNRGAVSSCLICTFFFTDRSILTYRLCFVRFVKLSRARLTPIDFTYCPLL